jgi:outer membrane receptor for ferrienterochelin and colicins
VTSCDRFNGRCWIALGLAIVLLCSSGRTVAAQTGADLADLSLEDLMNVRVERVFGASRSVQPATEAPSSVTIVTAEDISRHGHRTLADILRSVRGLFVTDDRNYSYVGTRGFARPGDYNSRLLVLVDGHRINDAVFDQAPIGRELGLDPATFQRVEIIRGPSSALYGTSAFFAVVSITTKRGEDVDGIAVRAGAGNLGRATISGVGGRRFANGLDVSFSAGLEDIDGHEELYYPEFDDPATNNGIATGLDGEALKTVSGRVSYRDLTISGAYGVREKTVPTAAFGSVFNNDHFVTEDRRGFIDAALDRTWRGTQYALRAYADTYRYDGTYPYEPESAGESPILSTDYGYGTWWGAEGRLTRRLPGRQTVTGGLEFRDYAQQAQGEAFEGDPDSTWDADITTHVFAAYVQDEVRLRDRLLISAGGRYDTYSGFDRFSPRASAVFMATPTRAIKYLFGSAFRAPNAYEFDYLTQGVRNTTLRPETITTHEFVWEEYTGDWLRTTVSAYRSDVSRLLELTANDQDELSYGNSGRVLARGLEFEGEVRTGGVQVVGSYAVQRTANRDTDQELTNSPRHLGKLRLIVPGPTSGATLAVEMQTISDRISVFRNVVPGHAVANLNYVHPLTGTVALTATVRNLFDADYADPASAEHRQDVIPQDGRTGYVGVRWTWTPPQR